MQRQVVNQEIAIRRRQRLTQAVQQITQVAARLCFPHIRPQRKGKLSAWLGRLAMQQQIGQQSLKSVSGQGRDRRFSIGEVKVAQELNVRNFS